MDTTEKKHQSALVLANAGEIVSSVIRQISGNDISNSINGSKITNEIIQSLTFQAINRKLKAA